MTDKMHQKNNFDILRLLFASIVIISHSYPLSGIRECDWLCQLTHGQLEFSKLGVKGFFIISGFLIFQSMERSTSLLQYYWKRVLRLFPALFVVLLLTVLLGPFVYHGATPYLANKAVLTYLPYNLSLYKMQYGIPGIFDNNPYPSAINGSLWTIAYEFTLYVLLSLLFFVRGSLQLLRAVVLIIFAVLAFANIFFIDHLGDHWFILSSRQLLDLGGFFAAGSLMAAFRVDQLSVRYKRILLFIGLGVLILSLAGGFFNAIKILTLPLVVICFGSMSTPGINNIGNRLGDLSYGIYIYGFPVQQTLEYFFHFHYLQLMACSLYVSWCLAYLSWHLVEARALKLKKISFR